MGSLTDVPGIRTGTWTDLRGLTGCTVVIPDQPAIVVSDVRGGAPGTRETEIGRAGTYVERAHAILLAGGSAYGLDAAAGVMRWLEERGAGLAVSGGVVPIVPVAVVFDLGVGSFTARPDASAGYAACAAASGEVAEGSVGAGTGCTVGKVLGRGAAMRGGQGTSSLRVGRYTIGALVAVNAVGDVVDPHSGVIIAGARLPDGSFAGADAWRSLDHPRASAPLNTTIGVVATDAPLGRDGAARVASMAHDGLARAVRPAHTLFDGDTLFVLCTGSESGAGLRHDAARLVNAAGAAAADAIADAIVRAVRAATALPGLPAAGTAGQA